MSDNRERIRQLLDQLEKLVKDMDVPTYKRTNPSWLQKNLKIKNETHPNFSKAMDLVKQLLSNGVGHA
jgi:uncharacterized protein (UPF0147 family)